ncbi:MAG TPA: hypothetical protein DDX98_04180 [Bacteroidales bacterium]|jgi:hypothetical protein|nr:hypothetical protein [Bacteroidales bacterium]
MKYIIIFCLLIPLILSSQEKKIKYLNENYQEIDKDEFLNGKSSKQYLDLYFESDTLIQCLLVRRKPIGRLNESQFNELKENLSIKDKIEDDLIVIIYYPGKDRCNGMERYSTWNIFDRDYLKKLKKISDISHHWIYKDDENLKYYYQKKIDWKKDNNQFIEKLFFKYHYPCFSCVVIDSKGNYIAYYGEFGKQTVWEIAEELKSI